MQPGTDNGSTCHQEVGAPPPPSSHHVMSPCDVSITSALRGTGKTTDRRKETIFQSFSGLNIHLKQRDTLLPERDGGITWIHLLPLLLLFNNSHLTMLIDKKSTTTEFKFPSFVEVCKANLVRHLVP